MYLYELILIYTAYVSPTICVLSRNKEAYQASMKVFVSNLVYIPYLYV